MTTILASDFETLLNHRDFIAILAVVLGCGTGIIAIVATSIAGVVRTKAREATKREIAAYVAEGSIDPDKAIAMLNAGASSYEIKGDGIRVGCMGGGKRVQA